MASVRTFAAFGFLPFALTRLAFFCLLPSAFLSCARPHFQFPTGAGAPAPDAAAVWTQTTEACRSARSFSAALRLSGHAGSQRLGRTINGAVTSDDQIYLEMPASFGAPYFVLAGTGDQATLVFDEKRVVAARADEIIEALIGLRLGPRQLLAILAGCTDQSSSISNGVQYPTVMAVTTPRARVFLQKVNDAWRPVAAQMDPLMIEYSEFVDRWPGRVRISSIATAPLSIDMSMALGQVEVNTTIPASAFVPRLPSGAIPVTLDELRRAGPLGQGRK